MIIMRDCVARIIIFFESFRSGSRAQRSVLSSRDVLVVAVCSIEHHISAVFVCVSTTIKECGGSLRVFRVL